MKTAIIPDMNDENIILSSKGHIVSKVISSAPGSGEEKHTGVKKKNDLQKMLEYATDIEKKRDIYELD